MSAGYCTVVYDGAKAPKGAEHLRAAVTVRGHVFPTGAPQSVPADLAAHLQRSAPAGTVTVREGTPAFLPPPMSGDLRAEILSQRTLRLRWGTDPASCLHELAAPLSEDARRVLAGATRAAVSAVEAGKLDAELMGVALYCVLTSAGDVAAAAARRATEIREVAALRGA